MSVQKVQQKYSYVRQHPDRSNGQIVVTQLFCLNVLQSVFVSFIIGYPLQILLPISSIMLI